MATYPPLRCEKEARYADCVHHGTRNWYLFDYGMVISQAPEPANWQRLRELSGQELSAPDSPYWKAREDYDADRLDMTGYWRLVLGSEAEQELLEALHEADLRAWAHLNPRTEDVLRQLQGSGGRLALLSNMPSAMADHYRTTCAWIRRFEQVFFSGYLGLVKPDPQIYRHVLEKLGAPAEQVVFIDDRQDNLDAAAALGIRTVLHHPAVELAAELGL